MAHYFSEEQDSPLDIEEVDFEIHGYTFKFMTSSGVFSKGKIDLGSYVFVRFMQIEENSRVLDLGCGYGVVGIVAAKAFKADVVMTDLNKRAVMLAKKNVKKNSVSAEVLQGNSFSEVTGEFDTILLNPPQHAGKDLCLSMIKESKDYLKVGGNFQMVARHKKGGKSLSEFMESVYGNIETVYIKSGFRIYKSIKEK